MVRLLLNGWRYRCNTQADCHDVGRTPPINMVKSNCSRKIFNFTLDCSWVAGTLLATGCPRRPRCGGQVMIMVIGSDIIDHMTIMTH